MSEIIIAGIVTYNPDIERLNQNIISIKKQVYKIIIVDNNSSNIKNIEKLIQKHENIELIKLNENMGIAFALNKIMSYADKNNIHWVLTLDQDSVCNENFVDILKKNIQDNVGIVCPIIHDINRNEEENLTYKNTYINRCITSGSLTSVNAWKKIGKFDEKMFIDGVDFDFCDRLIKNNFYIIQSGSISLTHEIGHIVIKKFLWFDVCVRNHSAFRKYYISRNIIYLDKKNKYKYYPIVTIIREIKLMLIVLLYEEDKLQKIKQIFKGIKDGFKMKI